MAIKKELQKDEKITIELPNKMVVLVFSPFDLEINVDEFTKIHYHNLMGEILTCSALLNRVGNYLAEIESILSETKMDFDIFYAQKCQEKRKNLEFTTTDTKGNPKVSKPTVDEVENAVLVTQEYRVKKTNLINVTKNRDIVNSLYWAIKSKDEKLNKLSDKLRPDEFEKDLIEEKINGFQIKMRDKSIK